MGYFVPSAEQSFMFNDCKDIQGWQKHYKNWCLFCLHLIVSALAIAPKVLKTEMKASSVAKKPNPNIFLITLIPHAHNHPVCSPCLSLGGNVKCCIGHHLTMLEVSYWNSLTWAIWLTGLFRLISRMTWSISGIELMFASQLDLALHSATSRKVVESSPHWKAGTGRPERSCTQILDNGVWRFQTLLNPLGSAKGECTGRLSRTCVKHF